MDSSTISGPWQIRLFGGLEAARGDTRITQFKTQPTASLLAYLAYHFSENHPRDLLGDLFWPNKPPEFQRHSLSQALYFLKTQFGSPALPWDRIMVGTNSEIRLNPRTVSTDVAQFAWLD